ncbi:MAG: GNAT family N-acetyltransferase [Candidatus Dormibacteria bacterium]
MVVGLRVEIAHSAELDAASLRAVRELLESSFDEVTEHDWDHALGGMHALAWNGSELIGHGSIIQRRLLYGGRALRAGYVEGVGVRPDSRRRGIGGAVMAELERFAGSAYNLGALGSSDDGLGLYLSRGWQSWRGRLAVLSPGGIVDTPDELGAVLVLPGAKPLDLDGELICDWREGDAW